MTCVAKPRAASREPRRRAISKGDSLSFIEFFYIVYVVVYVYD
jgi:hypothetical protein